MFFLKYSVFLFDADGTLFDFIKAEKVALKKSFLLNGLIFSEQALNIYHNINNELWLMLERGEITKPEIQRRRFRELFSTLGITGVDPDLFNAQYASFLGEGTYLIDGAHELCERLSKTAELAIVTNGVSETQKRRVGYSSINPFISHLFVSEAIGHAKPERAYFEYVMKQMNHGEKNDVLIIGDSLTADIKGGIDFGIDTCWVNPGKYKNESPYIPTYEIAGLNELFKLLGI